MSVIPQIARAERKATSGQHRLANQDRRFAVLFIFPAVLLVAVLMYYPMIRTFLQSFWETSMLRPEPVYVGLGQYTQLFADRRFWGMMGNSLVWTLMVVAFQAILGLASAVLLNQNLPAKGLMRALVLLPWVL